METIKDRYHVPISIQSCHTAIVDGYVIEGHVPVREIERLLNEGPDVIGIAVAGMPRGSPGMDASDSNKESFDVVTFTQEGEIIVFESYP